VTKPRRTLTRLAAVVAVFAVVVGACARSGGASNAPAASAGASQAAGAKGTVNIAINPWVGYEADGAVIGYLLENKLGYKVNKKTLNEQVSWEGFPTGEVDVILENWGHDDLAKKYIEQDKVAADAGPTGNKGIIGWYVPPWLATAHPDILDWNNLNKYADNFKTSESGGKGQLLDGDPSYVTNDEALVKNLNLNFEVVYAGSEAALIEAFKTAEAQKKWVIGYFYEPQWLFSQLKLQRVKLPPYTAGCDADPKKVSCDYPEYNLNKVVSKKFADTGGDAYTLIKKFSWTNDDQNVVAGYITNQGMTPEQAGKKWVDENEAKWQAWMP